MIIVMLFLFLISGIKIKHKELPINFTHKISEF